MSRSLSRALGALMLAGAAGSAFAQSTQVQLLRGTPAQPTPVAERTAFEVRDDGAFVAYGFVRDVGNTTGCASSLPATGAGTRFLWHPCRGAVRFGRVPTGQTNWDDANLDDFTFAGGNQVTASGYGAFSFGDQVNVSSTVGVGFGSAVTVSGTAGFSAGASNVCSGFACTAIGYTTHAAGQGSVALGYRTESAANYSVALGYRATTCTSGTQSAGTCTTPRTGAFVWGDESTTGYVNSQFDNEFRIRAAGGIRLRTSAAANAAAGVSGNTGCDLAAGSGTFSCSSSRTIKTAFEAIDAQSLLAGIRALPLSTWAYIEDTTGTRHLGPVAEDFFAQFGLGEGPSSIGAQDLASLGLVGVQALAERDEAHARELAALSERNAQLQAELQQSQALQQQLLERLSALEQRVGAANADHAR
jgi:hypothetical protein